MFVQERREEKEERKENERKIGDERKQQKMLKEIEFSKLIDIITLESCPAFLNGDGEDTVFVKIALMQGTPRA